MIFKEPSPETAHFWQMLGAWYETFPAVFSAIALLLVGLLVGAVVLIFS